MCPFTIWIIHSQIFLEIYHTTDFRANGWFVHCAIAFYDFLSNLILSIIFRTAPADASTTGTDASCTTDYIEVYKYIGSGFINENLKK